jgi:hypothetical protein
MKKQQGISKFATFAQQTIDQKQMIRVQGGGFWDWLGGSGTGGRNRQQV